jgi:hypothetical protein
MRRPTVTVVGDAVLTTERSSRGSGVGGGGGTGGVGGVGGGDGGCGGVGGSGGGVPLRTFVNVQTTTSPFETAPSTFVPFTETATAPLRVHSTLES